MNAHRPTRPSFKTHVSAQENILSNDHWFNCDEPNLGEHFTIAKAKERKGEVEGILWRAAKRYRRDGNAQLADKLEILADKLLFCSGRHRCGSLACMPCALGFQKAKFAGQLELTKRLKAEQPGKQFVMASLIPIRFTYKPDQLPQLDVRGTNRWLKDNLTRAGFKDEMFGSFDLSWEDGGFYQGHWHIPMLTSNCEELKRRLKSIFPASEIVKRPVVVSRTYSNDYLPYKDKAIKILDLLRRNRRGLPHLLLALDRTDPLELMVLMRLRVSAQNGELRFKSIGNHQYPRFERSYRQKRSTLRLAHC
jgi:hypothetical protein